MTVPASNAVVIFVITSHVCRAITMAGCRVHSTAIPRNEIAASACRFPLRKWHHYSSNDHFDRGLKPASLLQHETQSLLLRVRRERPRRRAAKQGDELAPFHGLPSSGREPHTTT